ncbi:hypothetical protein [Nocardiopsis synnemataformans]|uniref:hypothetical protein n=1 Tax=Nocardiopsis synnemataformans TaxID=61305 RepID=UPI003EBD6DCB
MRTNRLSPARFVALYKLAVTPGPIGVYDKRTVAYLLDVKLIEWGSKGRYYDLYRATPKGVAAAREHLTWLADREANGRDYRHGDEMYYQITPGVYRKKLDDAQAERAETNEESTNEQAGPTHDGEWGVFNDEGCTFVGSRTEVEAQAAKDRAEDDGYYAELISVHPICPEHEEQPKNACEECLTDAESDNDQDDAEEEQDTSAPVEKREFAVINTSRGDIRVHDATCADVTRDRKRYGFAPEIIHAADQCTIVAEFMSDFVNEGENPRDLDGDFVWLPCCGDLPWEAPTSQETELTPPPAEGRVIAHQGATRGTDPEHVNNPAARAAITTLTNAGFAPVTVNGEFAPTPGDGTTGFYAEVRYADTADEIVYVHDVLDGKLTWRRDTDSQLNAYTKALADAGWSIPTGTARVVRALPPVEPAPAEPSIVFELGKNRIGGVHQRRWSIGGRPSRDRAEARNILTDHYGWDVQDAEQALEDSARTAAVNQEAAPAPLSRRTRGTRIEDAITRHHGVDPDHARTIAAALGTAGFNALQSADEDGYLTAGHPASLASLAGKELVELAEHPAAGGGPRTYQITALGRVVARMKAAALANPTPKKHRPHRIHIKSTDTPTGRTYTATCRDCDHQAGPYDIRAIAEHEAANHRSATGRAA